MKRSTICHLARRAGWLAMATLLLLPFNAMAAGNIRSEYDLNTRGDTTPAGGLFKGLEDCLKTGNCTLCEIFSVASNAVNILVGLAGGVALGFLLWIAFGLVGSRGNAEAVKASKEGLWKLAIGFFFFILAYELVILVIHVMAGDFTLAPPWQSLKCVR